LPASQIRPGLPVLAPGIIGGLQGLRAGRQTSASISPTRNMSAMINPLGAKAGIRAAGGALIRASK